MFDKILDWFGWKKKEASVVFEGTTADLLNAAKELKTEEEVKPAPPTFTIPNPAILYPRCCDEESAYTGPIDRAVEEMFANVPDKPQVEPLADPPPSIDIFLNKPEVKPEEVETTDPLLLATVKELSKESEHEKLSSKISAPRKKDPLVVAVAKNLSKKPTTKKNLEKPAKKKPAKKKVVKKTKSKTKK
jgi:hypothetical protein